MTELRVGNDRVLGVINITMFERIIFIVIVICGNVYSEDLDTCEEFVLKNEYFNKKLVGHVVFETTVVNHHECVKECLSLSVCKSIDYYKRENTCKLNDVNSFDVDVSEFVTKTGAIFSDINDWPNTMYGSCSSRPCSSNQRCFTTKETFLCMDITCDSEPSIEHGEIILDAPEKNKFRDKATVECSATYFPSQPEVKCQASGEWEQAACKQSTDCKQISEALPNAMSGVYDITLWQTGQILSVYCDMETDDGGWTVFQRRFDGSVDFYRTFTEYENGFGTAEGEFWLGLKYVKELAEQGPTELRTDMSKADGAEAYETFQDFSLNGPNYKLSIGSRVGTTGDATYGLKYNNGYPFTAKDSSNANCANARLGGWWYHACTWSNLNGKYYTPGTSNGDMSGLTHNGFAGYESMLTSKMMLRRV